MSENIVGLALVDVADQQIAMEGFFQDLGKTIRGWKEKLTGSPDEVNQAVKEQLAKIASIETALKKLKTEVSQAKIDKAASVKLASVLGTLGLTSPDSASGFLAALEADLNKSTANAKKALALASKIASGKATEAEIKEAQALKQSAAKGKGSGGESKTAFTKQDLLRLIDVGLKSCAAQKALLQGSNPAAVKKAVDSSKNVAMEALGVDDTPHLAQELWNATVEILKHSMTALVIIVKLLWIGTKLVISWVAKGITAIGGAIDDVMN